jgi:hypothetical protein
VVRVFGNPVGGSFELSSWWDAGTPLNVVPLESSRALKRGPGFALAWTGECARPHTGSVFTVVRLHTSLPPHWLVSILVPQVFLWGYWRPVALKV